MTQKAKMMILTFDHSQHMMAYALQTIDQIHDPATFDQIQYPMDNMLPTSGSFQILVHFKFLSICQFLLFSMFMSFQLNHFCFL